MFWSESTFLNWKHILIFSKYCNLQFLCCMDILSEIRETVMGSSHYTYRLVIYDVYAHLGTFKKNQNIFWSPHIFQLCLPKRYNLYTKALSQSYFRYWREIFFTKPLSRSYVTSHKTVSNGGLSEIRSLHTYTDSQKHESTLLHTYVLNVFLTADHSCTAKYFWKKLL